MISDKDLLELRTNAIIKQQPILIDMQKIKNERERRINNLEKDEQTTIHQINYSEKSEIERRKEGIKRKTIDLESVHKRYQERIERSKIALEDKELKIIKRFNIDLPNFFYDKEKYKNEHQYNIFLGCNHWDMLSVQFNELYQLLLKMMDDKELEFFNDLTTCFMISFGLPSINGTTIRNNLIQIEYNKDYLDELLSDDVLERISQFINDQSLDFFSVHHDLLNKEPDEITEEEKSSFLDSLKHLLIELRGVLVAISPMQILPRLQIDPGSLDQYPELENDVVSDLDNLIDEAFDEDCGLEDDLFDKLSQDLS